MILLHGEIAGLKRARRSHDFILTEMQQDQIAVTAIGANVMGMGAAGIGLLNMAANSEEEADWVEFELDGKQVKGWLWLMPMCNGDTVQVAAQRVGENRYIAYAIKRESDDVVSVYPHAIRGRKALYRWLTKIMLCIHVPLNLMAMFFMHTPKDSGENLWPFIFFMSAAFMLTLIIFSIIFYRVSRKMMGVVIMAETIFRTFGWQNVENIDLHKSSRENRRQGDKKFDYGNYYFRYR